MAKCGLQMKVDDVQKEIIMEPFNFSNTESIHISDWEMENYNIVE